MSSLAYSPTATEFFDRVLSKAFAYNFPDVVKNREGRLAPDQFKRMVWSVISPVVQALLFTTLLFLLHTLLFMMFGKAGWAGVLQGFLQFAIAVGLILSSVRLALLIGDWRKGPVFVVRGRLELHWNVEAELVKDDGSRSAKSSTRSLEVGGEKFRVSTAAARTIGNKFESGMPIVKVYYTPASRRILSIETLAVDVPSSQQTRWRG